MDNLINNGALIISLDFELMWGLRDLPDFKLFEESVINVQKVIPELIIIFNKYKINATFAVIGFLFAKDKEELNVFSPKIKPQYSNKNLSPYDGYLEEIGKNENDDKLHYASSLIKLINKNPNLEIGTHTFSHYYCMEDGQNIDSFKSDIASAKQIAEHNAIKLSSLIFPKNQIKKEYFPVLTANDIICYRGNETSWFLKANIGDEKKIIKRLFRLLDTYINISGHNCYFINDIEKTQPYNLASSRYLRPYSPKLKSIEVLKIKRIKDSMTFAAKNKKIYHLWWHPHNFGLNQNENFDLLETILKHFTYLKNEYGFESYSMRDLSLKLTN